MIATLIMAAVVALGAAVYALLGPIRNALREIAEAARHVREVFEETREARLDMLEKQISEMGEVVERLPSKWDDIKRETKRLKDRADWHVRRARKELARHGFEDAELEGMAGELDLRDDPASAASGMHPVPTGVASSEPPHPWAGFEDWEIETMRRKYGQ